MTSVSNLDDIPRLDLFPDTEVPGYYRGESPEVLRVDSRASQNGPANTRFAGRKPETPLSPPRTPQTPPTNPYVHHKPRGRYVLQRVRKRPLTVSLSILYLFFSMSESLHSVNLVLKCHIICIIDDISDL